MNNIKIYKNILTKNEIDFILKGISSIDEWDLGGGKFWNNKSLSPLSLQENNKKEISILLLDIRDRMEKTIKDLYGIDKKIYADLIQIARWFPNTSLPVHTDVEGGEWFHHREYAGIIYLNNDYEGGQTYYPEYNFKTSPEPGMLVTHTGDTLHGIEEIHNKIRYTINSFWTTDEKYENKYDII
jgi:hypothetical protein